MEGAGPPLDPLFREADQVVSAARARDATRPAADAEFRAAVERYAAAARAAGLPPQRLLIDLKQLLASGALVHVDQRLRGTIVERAVRWAIHGYYPSSRPTANPS